MTTLKELREQLRQLISGEPVHTKYGNFPEFPTDGAEAEERFYGTRVSPYRNSEKKAALVIEQLAKEIEILEKIGLGEEDENREGKGLATFNFYKSGDVWMIGEGGKEIPLNHSVGLAEIHFLLKHEGAQYKHDTLYSQSAGSGSTGSHSKKDAIDPTTVSKAIQGALEKIKNTAGLGGLKDYLNMERLKTGARGTYKYNPDPAKPVLWNLDAPA